MARTFFMTILTTYLFFFLFSGPNSVYCLNMCDRNSLIQGHNEVLLTYNSDKRSTTSSRTPDGRVEPTTPDSPLSSTENVRNTTIQHKATDSSTIRSAITTGNDRSIQTSSTREPSRKTSDYDTTQDTQQNYSQSPALQRSDPRMNEGSSVDPDGTRKKRSSFRFGKFRKRSLLQAEENPGCGCTVTTTSPTDINLTLLGIWVQTAPDGVSLIVEHVISDHQKDNMSQSLTNIWRKAQPWKKRYTTTWLRILVKTSQDSPAFSLFIHVQADNMTVTCFGTGNSAARTTSGLFRIPDHPQSTNNDQDIASDSGVYMFIVGAGLLLVAVVLLIAAVLAWHRYRAKQKRRAEPSIEINISHEDKYEDVTATEGGFSVCGSDSGASRRIERDPPSKSSMTSLAKREDAASSRSHSLDAANAADGAKGGKRTPSPAASPTVRFSFLRKKKSKSKKGRGNAAASCSIHKQDDDEEDYSTVQSEHYEVISDIPSPTSKTKVPTPLLLDVNARAATLNPLKSIEAHTRARNKPKLELPATRKFSQGYVKKENGDYSHLDRAGRSKSFDLTKMENYDDVTLKEAGRATVRCKTADIAVGGGTKFEFAPRSPSLGNDTSYPKLSEPSQADVTQVNEDNIYEDAEGDHIYEAYESSSSTAGMTKLNVANLILPSKPPSAGHKYLNVDSAAGAAETLARSPSPSDIPADYSFASLSFPSPNNDHVTEDTEDMPRHEYDYMTDTQLHVIQEITGDHDADKAPESREDQKSTPGPLEAPQEECTYEIVGEFNVPSTHSASASIVEDALTARASPPPQTAEASQHHGLDPNVEDSKDDVNNLTNQKNTDLAGAGKDTNQTELSSADHSKNPEHTAASVQQSESPNCKPSSDKGPDLPGQRPDLLPDAVPGSEEINKDVDEPEEYIITENILYEPLKLREPATEINVKL